MAFLWRIISDYVNDKGEVEPDNEKVVVFMKR